MRWGRGGDRPRYRQRGLYPQDKTRSGVISQLHGNLLRADADAHVDTVTPEHTSVAVETLRSRGWTSTPAVAP
jgi:hypothetical protein